jgi:hypothetical protein
MSKTYLPDAALREHVGKILESHKVFSPYGTSGPKKFEPISGIGIISTDRLTDVEICDEDRLVINDARLIVFISFIAHQNTLVHNFNSGHSMASSENFAPIYFSTVVGDRIMTELGGFVVSSWHGGISIEENMIIRLRHVPKPKFAMDIKLLETLILLRERKKLVFRRFISAIEIFFESYYNAPEVSHNARILLQASAFEILLGSKTSEGRRDLKLFLKVKATYPDDEKLSFSSERKNGCVTEIGTIKEQWADRFFTLRNHIIHGKVPTESEFYFGEWQRHFDIALYFFVFCLKRKLEEELGEEIFGDDVEWKTWTDELQIAPKKITGFEYETVGRRYWERKMKGAQN